MSLVRLTIRPWETVEVGDVELQDLIRQGLVYTMLSRLYVNFYVYQGGPPAAVTGVTVQISKNNSIIVGPTSAVTQQDVGAYAYDWSEADREGDGLYVVLWSATDATGATVTAQESVFLEE